MEKDGETDATGSITRFVDHLIPSSGPERRGGVRAHIADAATRAGGLETVAWRRFKTAWGRSCRSSRQDAGALAVVSWASQSDAATTVRGQRYSDTN